MSEMLRTFIAVAVPCPPALRPVVRSLGEMGNAVKPVSPDNLHITLKFLGDTPAEQVTEITDILAEAVAGTEPFAMEFRGVDAFPRKERPGVVWAGVVNGEPLIQIAIRLEKRLKTLGYPKERRPFSPHLTLARIRAKPSPLLAAFFEKYAATQFGSVNVNAVRFYRSELTPAGSVYSVLAEAKLPGDN